LLANAFAVAVMVRYVSALSKLTLNHSKFIQCGF